MSLLFYEVLRGAAFGATIGIIVGSGKTVVRQRRQHRQSPEQVEAPRSRTFGQRLLSFLAKVVWPVLGLALVWTVYFAVLGIADPAQNEYAANASTLIVSVATVFSIMIAFYEFIKPKNE